MKKKESKRRKQVEVSEDMMQTEEAGFNLLYQLSLLRNPHIPLFSSHHIINVSPTVTASNLLVDKEGVRAPSKMLCKSMYVGGGYVVTLDCRERGFGCEGLSSAANSQ
ncbi:hypothetical protein JHK82_022619 [Glycine max]|nr:hypothetical protein JHK85_023109 [Glycine max]KAG5026724.1 hypothetical protein JHK86_022638 [Glycine max]KAG5137888.1 hypothetical protein JHK82_022619 [Glycine max]